LLLKNDASQGLSLMCDREVYRAGRWFLETGNDSQQRRLAAAARPDDA
jgi:hypothetical protein